MTAPARTLTAAEVADALAPTGPYRAVFDASLDGIYSFDLEGRCRYVNPAAERLFGYPAAELLGQNMHELLHATHEDGNPYPYHECPMGVAIATAGSGTAPTSAESGFWRADGTYLNADWRIQQVFVDGEVVGAVVKFAVVEPAPSEDDLGRALAANTDGFVGTEADGTVTAWNAAAEEALGWTAKEMLGRSFLDLLVVDGTRPDLRGPLAELVSRDGADFPLVVKDMRVMRRDGTEAELEASIARVPWAGGSRFHTFLRDVSALRRAESSLARSEAMYRLLVAASRDVISRHTPSGDMSFVSPAVEELFGWTPGDLIGRNLAHLVHPQDIDDLFVEVLGGDGGSGGEWTFRVQHREGHWVWVESTSTVIRDDRGRVSEVLVCSRDITARRAREAASQQDSKLESLGRLSAGLAHEINTPIQYVGDNARFLSEAFTDLMGLVALYRQTLTAETAVPWSERLPAMQAAERDMEIDYLESEVPSAITQTLAGIDRVATIVRAMKTFSHPGHDEHVPADLNEALTATVTVTRHQVHQVADLELDLGELPPVRCNIAELNQVFLNLIVNAADAIEETGRHGLIRVATRVDGADVLISVSDTGGGIPEHIRAKVFDPFFTTKEVGRGTGQGLPLARSVVTDGHGGTLSLDTEPGVGTTLTIRLPIAGAASSSDGGPDTEGGA
ncbi:PAS domain S-box protein [Modestobacter sp. VKM Ac-2986]|uniref:PAS domain-containing sensor histidine kinase n=1 Tax=Modestobacter sp. VKM Ac-2986 TaxID=3004140 RepID=UPI0022AA3CE4|nr:PAS domain S-box protein [Modestobacter sp. VKM Ac-2986]MCZ2827549.1 PAS domain S-box protein [Modestobacter sp. VKM Ac-2986]